MQEILNDRDHVYRITVDEQLSETQFRFLISRCALNAINTVIDNGNWDDEIETYGSKNKILELINLMNINPEISKWASISEGQVYLAGMFELIEEFSGGIYLRSGQKYSFIRIDYYLKDTVRKLYEDALTGKGDYAETNLK